MIKIISVSFLILTISSYSFTKKFSFKNSPSKYSVQYKDTDKLVYPLLFLYTIEGQKDTLEMGWPHLVKDWQIKSKQIIKKEAAVQRYGERSQNGVIIYTYIKGTRILTIDQLLKTFHVSKKYRDANLTIDGIYCNQTQEKTIFTLERIKTVNLAWDSFDGKNRMIISTTDDAGKLAKDVVEYMEYKGPYLK